MFRLILLTVFIFAALDGHSQGMNFSHKYDVNSPVNLQYLTVYNQNSTEVLLKIQSQDSLTMYEGFLDFRSSYSQSKPDSSANIYLENALYDSTISSWRLDLSFNKVDFKRLLILQFVNKISGMSFSFDIPLFYHSEINQPSTILYDSEMQNPIFASYLNTSTVYKTDQNEIVTYYPIQFKAATPPMSLSSPKGGDVLLKDSTFIVLPDDDFTLQQEGMYFFENDSSNLHGTAYCVRSSPYPKYSTVQELIAPLRYICTNSEYTKLYTDPSKENFESVWMEITNDENRAKQLIKNYYTQIALSNRLFSSYKEGWKTDKGMTLIVFGSPNEVHKTDTKEEWIYSGNTLQSKLKFTFAKVDNIYSADHYVLIRKKEYKIPWMNRVDMWRKGKITN